MTNRTNPIHRVGYTNRLGYYCVCCRGVVFDVALDSTATIQPIAVGDRPRPARIPILHNGHRLGPTLFCPYCEHPLRVTHPELAVPLHRLALQDYLPKRLNLGYYPLKRYDDSGIEGKGDLCLEDQYRDATFLFAIRTDANGARSPEANRLIDGLSALKDQWSGWSFDITDPEPKPEDLTDEEDAPGTRIRVCFTLNLANAEGHGWMLNRIVQVLSALAYWLETHPAASLADDDEAPELEAEDE